MMTSTKDVPTSSIEITDPRQRLAFVPELFFTAQSDQLVTSWLTGPVVTGPLRKEDL